LEDLKERVYLGEGRRQKNNTKRKPKGIGCEGVNRIKLTED
jgi:hypothetical protein